MFFKETSFSREKILGKRVLHLISPIGYFGAENVMIELARGLCSTEYKPYIGIIGNHQNTHFAVIEQAKKHNLIVEEFKCYGKFDLRTILAIRQFIICNMIDIIHSHGYKSNFYHLLASLFLSVKRITTCHNWIGGSVFVKSYENLDKILLNCFDKVVGVSERLGQEIEHCKVVKGKVNIIYNGIDVTKFRCYDEKRRLQIKGMVGIDEDALIIGTIGRLTPEKGHIYLIRAFAKVALILPKVQLLIIGDGVLKYNLKSQAKNLGILDKIIFLGTRHDIPDLLDIIDIFVLPSLDEEMPMVLLEAMASRKLIISSMVGAIPKIIEDGHSGILVKPKDVDGLCASILYALNNKNKLLSFSENAFNVVSKSFSSQNMINSYRKLYNSVLSNENKE